MAEGAAGLQHAPEIPAAGVVDIGWRGRENFRDYFADLGQRLLELGIFRGIFLREGGDGRRGFVFVLVERKRASVGREAR